MYTKETVQKLQTATSKFLKDLEKSGIPAKEIENLRTVLRFHPRMAPFKCAVFPLLKNNAELVAKARQIFETLRPHLYVFYDESGAIGRRYRRQDEIGTPFAVTVDFETLGERDGSLRDTVTLRERDSMKQERVQIPELMNLLSARIA